jgi:hypothetical protein
MESGAAGDAEAVAISEQQSLEQQERAGVAGVGEAAPGRGLLSLAREAPSREAPSIGPEEGDGCDGKAGRPAGRASMKARIWSRTRR